MLYPIKQVPVEKFKARYPEKKSGVKTVVCLSFFLLAGNARAQSPEDGSFKPEVTESVTQPVSRQNPVSGASDEEPVTETGSDATGEETIEWFAEDEEAPKIYRKDNVKNPCDRGLDT